MGPYKVKAIISANVVELELPRTVNISPVVNISRIRWYVEQVDSQRKEALKGGKRGFDCDKQSVKVVVAISNHMLKV